MSTAFGNVIYNSRNYSILLNRVEAEKRTLIYNSRNYSILLNYLRMIVIDTLSTTVEIILYYLTRESTLNPAHLQQ